ncbi:hypothetical protein SNOG_07942 [Parastagonospora nodorum SN15]|uniref:Heterokaryon incompatibility domain-containing protein n=1 Tax=Phaeosphaeria nodorum (strain SN15 / ATCC MYA-4574 / FGSC 10173) TaxID=321614 RepID=Q0UJX2_PHANO|nr:hypothetical protein SNOG_07942 [Parastagonospora nodorum SN15]EAT84218.1 hypothetical protein SNOG_07942 [Parastagonospora nodorum SN15]
MEVQSTYNRLPKDHIRLLHVYPDETGQRIRCQLLATNINTGPDYQALSYVNTCGPECVEVHATTVVWTGPSWVTDWNNVNWWVEDRIRILNEIYKPICSTSGNSKPRCKVRDRGQLLDVAGHIVDCIVLANGESWDAKSPGLTRQLPAIKEQLRAQHPNHAQKGNDFNKFWHALPADNPILQQNLVVYFHTNLWATATYVSHQSDGLRSPILSYSFSGTLGNIQN